MKSTLTFSQLQVKQSPIHGYGVFALQAFLPNQTIEECHLLAAHRLDPAFNDYCLEHNGQVYLPLGFGALYNHAETPNADFEFDQENRVMQVFARSPIAFGEEIFLSYGEGWFSSRKMQAKPVSLAFKYRKFVASWSYLWRFLAVFGALLLFRFFEQ
jgi:hypothetical protein